MSKLVLVDFSNFARTCWFPALAAEDAGKKSLEEHSKTCTLCGLGPTQLCKERPRQYDAKLVLHTNLDAKLETLKELLGVVPNNYVFVKDGHAATKYAIFPGYKANRDRTQYDPRDLAEGHVRNSLAPNASWAWNKDFEADDCIATLALKGSRSDLDVIVVSGDRDLWPLLQYPRVTIYSLAHKAFIGPAHVKKAFDVDDPKFIPLCKSLWGDSGDNVPNAVPRMQRPLLPVIQASDGTLMDFLHKTDSYPLTDRCVQLLQQNLRQVCCNNQLVKLDMNVPIEMLP